MSKATPPTAVREVRPMVTELLEKYLERYLF